MRLYDPTSSGPKKSLSRAAPIARLDGKNIGILENGKLNAPEMLREIAALFEQRHGCTIGVVYHKSTLEKAVKEVDFLITGLGD
jgi:hypothetical protein